MRLRRFEYLEAATLDEALAVIERDGEDLRLLAGGTALLLMVRHGIVTPRRVLSLGRIPELGGIRADGDTIRIGALTSHAEVASADLIRRRCPILAAAAARVATPAIRNMGTLGGNLCYAESASDPAPALVSLDARAVVRSVRGSRTIPIADGFYRGFYETSLEANEILVAIEVPAQATPGAETYVKWSPRSLEDKALVGLAAVVDAGPGGTCRQLRLGLGGVNPTPLRLRKAEALAQGQALSDALIGAVARTAAAEVEPISDVQGSADYRREMVEVWVGRALRELRGRLGPRR